MTRDNEDRIVRLQNKVDDMNQEVVKQKREILEYKSKEKNSLGQIGAVSCFDCFLLTIIGYYYNLLSFFFLINVFDG